MTTQRSFTDPFKAVDVTEALLVIPNRWNLTAELGIFEEKSVAQNTIQFEQVDQTLAIVTDQVRGSRNLVNKDRTRKIHAFALTHHPLDDYLTGADIAGVRAYGDANAAETEQAAVLRKLEDMAMKHDVTLELARINTIVTGNQWAPNGTVTQDFYTAFGVPRTTVVADLTNVATNVVEKNEAGIAQIQDSLTTGFVPGRFVKLCSPAYFAKYIKNASVVDAYKFYTSGQEVLRNRLGGDGQYRTFVHGGVTLVEYRGAFNGVPLIPAGEAYMLPTNVPGFAQTYFGPASKLSAVNKLGERRYAWTYRDPKDEFVEMQSEQNFLNLLRYPQAVVKYTTT
jgi:hypothetical protein